MKETKWIKRVVLSLLLVLVGVCFAPMEAKAATDDSLIAIPGGLYYSEAYDLLEMVNEERNNVGLKSLVMDEALLEAAMYRAAESSVYYYNERPNGMEFSSLIDATYCTQNRAFGDSAEEVMSFWMGTAEYMANILDKNVNSIGVGVFYQQGEVYWVLLFADMDDPKEAEQPRNQYVLANIWVDTLYLRCDYDDTKLMPGETVELNYYILNHIRLTVAESGTADYTWVDKSCLTFYSESPDVAMVDEYGVVTAKSGGTARIQARPLIGNRRSATDVYVIDVNGTPWISSLTNEYGGVRITWAGLPDIKNYRVFVKTDGSNWKAVGHSSTTNFLYTEVENNKEYIFTVRGVTADGSTYISNFDNRNRSIVYRETPVITSISNTANGPRIAWTPIEGAQKYIVFYREAGGQWTPVGKTTENSITFTEAESGTLYAYTVRCLVDNIYESGHAPGKGSVFIAQPQVAKLTPTKNGVNITWGEVNGAAQYRVYMKTGGGSWKNIGTTSNTNLSYSGLTSGKSYTFTVRCLNAAGTAFTSSYDPVGKSITFAAQPAVKAIANTAEGMKISWDAVAGAEKYRVYAKVAGGSWKNIGTTDGTSLIFDEAQSGTLYAFTVRCINAKENVFTSSFDPIGKGAVYIAQPKVTELTNTADGVQVTWDAVPGAAQYRVYVKTAGGTWKNIGTTADTTLTYSDTVEGTEYIFTVRCLNAKGNAFTSSFDPNGWSITYTK